MPFQDFLPFGGEPGLFLPMDALYEITPIMHMFLIAHQSINISKHFFQ